MRLPVLAVNSNHNDLHHDAAQFIGLTLQGLLTQPSWHQTCLLSYAAALIQDITNLQDRSGDFPPGLAMKKWIRPASL